MTSPHQSIAAAGSPISLAPTPAGGRKPRRLPWRRWGFWFALALLACLALFSARKYVRHVQAGDRLQTYLEELDRAEPGWRLSQLEAARAAVPDADNAALRVEAADALILKSEVDGPFYNRLRSLAPNERPLAADAARLREEMKPQERALEKARELADLPSGRFTVPLERNVLQTQLPHCDMVRNASSLLYFDALLRAEDGDAKAALRSCRAAVNAGRSIGDEPHGIAQLIRINSVHEACTGVERVLAQGQPDADDLRDLQKLLEDEERFPRLLVMERGERALLNEMLDAVESGDVPLAELTKIVRLRADADATPLSSVDAVRADHPSLMRTMTDAVAIARLPVHERREQVRAFETALQEDPDRTVLHGLMFALGRLDGVSRRADGRLRCLIVALAVEQYRLKHGRWPEALTDLLPEQLAAIPLDPEDGRPLGYQRYEDRVVVFARLVAPFGGFARLGPSQAFDPKEPSPPGIGIAVHLFAVEHRRQPARPRPPLTLPFPPGGDGRVRGAPGGIPLPVKRIPPVPGGAP